MRTDNIWLIAIACVVAVAAIVGAIFFTRDFTTRQAPASTVTASQLMNEEGGEAFEVADQIDAVLFFNSWSNPRRHVAVKKKIYNMISLDQQISQVIQMLINGPEPEEGARTVPRETRLLRVYMSRDGVANLVFSSELATELPQGTAAELSALYSIVNTLCVNFPSIQAVQIIVKGSNNSTLVGHVDISVPLVMDESYFARQFPPTPEAIPGEEGDALDGDDSETEETGEIEFE